MKQKFKKSIMILSARLGVLQQLSALPAAKAARCGVCAGPFHDGKLGSHTVIRWPEGIGRVSEGCH